MCGVSPSAAPDMTGLGGKVRTVPSSNTTTSTGEGESAGEGAGAEVSFEHTTDNMLHEVSTACIMLLFTCMHICAVVGLPIQYLFLHHSYMYFYSNTVYLPISPLPQVSCMNAYVHTLANFAELYEVTGNTIEKEEYVSAALAAIQEYERHLAGAGHAPVSDTDAATVHSLEQLGKHDGAHPSRVAHRPVLGRVLALAAHREMSVGQAVTAEGLYRSALDHLASPTATYDTRYVLLLL